MLHCFDHLYYFLRFQQYQKALKLQFRMCLLLAIQDIGTHDMKHEMNSKKATSLSHVTEQVKEIVELTTKAQADIFIEWQPDSSCSTCSGCHYLIIEWACKCGHLSSKSFRPVEGHSIFRWNCFFVTEASDCVHEISRSSWDLNLGISITSWMFLPLRS